MQNSIKTQLKRYGAIGPGTTVNPDIIRESLSAEPLRFATALSELADLEQVGIISGQIYLRIAET